MKEFAITLNGNSVQGYPVKIRNGYPIIPYYKFYDAVSKLGNIDAPAQQTLAGFKDNIIYAHRFEGEDSPQGWLGANITTVSPNGFSEQYTLGSEICILLDLKRLISSLDSQQHPSYNRQIPYRGEKRHVILYKTIFICLLQFLNMNKHV